MGLRESIRNPPNFSSSNNINFAGTSLYTSVNSNSANNYSSPNNSPGLNDSQKSSPMLSPKMKSAMELMKNVDEEAGKNMKPIMSKKSPIKDYANDKSQ